MSQLPTEEEIRSLPRWAQVALAARCARRFIYRSKDERIQEAVDLTEEAAASGRIGDIVKDVSRLALMSLSCLCEEADLMFDDLYDLGLLDPDDDEGIRRHNRWFEETQGLIVNAIASAAHAIAALGETPTPFSPENHVFRSVQSCSQAAAMDLREEIEREIREDFNRLLEAAKNEAWTDETTVPACFWKDTHSSGRRSDKGLSG